MPQRADVTYPNIHGIIGPTGRQSKTATVNAVEPLQFKEATVRIEAAAEDRRIPVWDGCRARHIIHVPARLAGLAYTAICLLIYLCPVRTRT
jgi:hypothetical protein